MTSSSRDFDLLPWHDALLLGISVDRRTPGERDEVTVAVRWGDDLSETLKFIGCYAFESRMNFGVIAEESILEAHCTRTSEELAALRQKWARIGVDLADLRCYEIQTSTTASVFGTLRWGS
jgi:hypothetical protein